MTRKKLILTVAIAVFYCLLLVLLVQAESAYVPAEGEETISTFPKALWYSLTTLTTVGYGDLYPHTVAGRIIGAVFQLLSVGFLVFLISAVLSKMRNRIIPRIRLFFSADKDWYIFTAYNPESAALARNLNREAKGRLFLFTGDSFAEGGKRLPEGVGTMFTVNELVRMKKGRGKAVVFCMDGSGFINYRAALTVEDTPVYCMTEYEPDRTTDRFTVFHPYQCCARLYWQRFPIRDVRETIALIGGGKYAAAILEQALLLNVYAPDQHLTYLVYGEPDGFSAYHPHLREILSVGTEDPDGDSLLFLTEEWCADPERLRNADRIILCYDSEEDNAQALCRLRRYIPVNGAVYARLSEPVDQAVSFGSAEEIFTPQLVMKEDLDKAAITLNEIYRKSTGGTSPAWNDLSGFLRRSNLASADHLDVKIQLLLGEIDRSTPPKELYARAYRAYLKRKDRDAEFFREVEHIRWMRFHLLNNWQYAPVRDNAQRKHPLLLPYDRIPVEEHLKDDYTWELLGKLSEWDA